MLGEPVGSKVGDRFEFPLALDHRQFRPTGQCGQRRPVAHQHLSVGAAADEQRRASDRRQRRRREVDTAATGDDGTDVVAVRRGAQRGRGAGARSELTEAQVRRPLAATKPPRRPEQPLGQEVDVEPRLVRSILRLGQEVEKQVPKPRARSTSAT